MVLLRATCPTCLSPVGVAPSRTSVERPAYGGGAEVTFTCPQCSAPVTLQVEDEMARHLVTHGSRLVDASPADAAGIRVEADPPPLCHDDLLDLHDLLARDDWFERLRALVE